MSGKKSNQKQYLTAHYLLSIVSINSVYEYFYLHIIILYYSYDDDGELVADVLK